MIVENLFTNPSFETASGTVTVRTNLCTNPNFETNVTGWYTYSGTAVPTRVTTTPFSGVGRLSAVGNGSANNPRVIYTLDGVAGDVVSYSVRIRSDGQTPTTAYAGIKSMPSNTILAAITDAWAPDANGWQLIKATATMPTGDTLFQITPGLVATAFAGTLGLDEVMIENAPAPGSYFDGSTPAASDFTYAWAGTANASTSVRRGVGVASLAAANAAAIQSTGWAALGTKSARIIPNSLSNYTPAYVTLTGLTVGAVYTVIGTVRVPSALTGALDSQALNIYVNTSSTNLPGYEAPANGIVVKDVRITFTATATVHKALFFNGASIGGGDVWWDAVGAVAGTYTGPYFDGDITSTDTVTYTWTGSENASSSRWVTYLDGTNLTIGRFGIDITVDSVSQWDEQGNRVTVSGQTHHGSIADALTLRQQLMGYVDSPDESFVPVTWADQPSVNGFYRVRSVSVTPDSAGAFAGVFRFSVELERVQGFAAPLVECVAVGKLRTSGMALTARPFQGIPAGGRSFNEYHPDTRTSWQRAVDVRRAGESSVVNVFSRGTTASDDYVVGQVYLPPAKFYEGAATLLINGQVVTGRQIQNAPADWLLSNDLFQVRPAAGVTASVEMRAWVSGGWSAWVKATLQSGIAEPSVGDPLPAPHTITVLSNSPEAVTIRLLTTVSFAPVTVDITLRRGAHYVSAEMNANDYQFFTLKVPDFSAPTARTGGFSQVLIGGGTGVFGSAVGAGPARFGTMFRQDAGVGFAPQYWNNFFSFCIGITPEAAQTLLNEYFWAGSEKQAVVAR